MSYQRIRWINIGILLFFFICTIIMAAMLQQYRSPEFSVESGFYEEPFYLEIRGGGTIYYTLDSSVPTEESLLYSGPILIDDASKKDNVYSSIQSVSPLLNEELIKLGLVPNRGYVVPKKVDKCNVVRAISVDDFGNRSDISTGIFFVGFDEKIGYDGLNIVSVITDPSNLFDYFDGIYVDGIDYAKWMAARDLTEIYDYEDWSRGNYRRRGKTARREAIFSVWDIEKYTPINILVDISIQGGGARAWIPKNFNVYKKDKNILPWFSNNQESYNLNAGGQDRNTKLRDRLVNEFTSDLKMGTRQFKPCAVFLDGEYWGTYHLTERFDESYFETKYSINRNEVIMIKTGSIEIGKSSDLQLYQDMVDVIIQMDMSEKNAFDEVCKIIDLESFLDYYATEIYIANTDWPSANYALFRSRDKGSTQYEDTRWRWLIYDVNHSMKKFDLDIDGIAKSDILFESLISNNDIYGMLVERLVFLAKEVFNPEIVEKYIDEYAIQLGAAIENEYYRYYGENVEKDMFYSNCDQVKDFFHKRYDYIISMYRSAS